jgi:uncharacterized membrane protein
MLPSTKPKPLSKTSTNSVLGTALQNYQKWRANPVDDTMVTGALEYEYGADLAVLECGKQHKLWSEREIADCQEDLVKRYMYGTSDRFEHSLQLDIKEQKEKQKEQQKKIQFLSRLTMALFGGAALVAPMLIMTLHQSKLTSLLTTSLFLVAVALALSRWMEDATGKDIMGATAAYAAVLVVFVGTAG